MSWTLGSWKNVTSYIMAVNIPPYGGTCVVNPLFGRLVPYFFKTRTVSLVYNLEKFNYIWNQKCSLTMSIKIFYGD